MRPDVGSIHSKLKSELSRVIVGQGSVIDMIIVGLFAGGHILLEGVPGTAKTFILKTLAAALDCSFARIQFTPDLMPSDIVGVNIFDPSEGRFVFREGPVFNNFILCDEINRAPAKTQSALLESMQEKLVSVDGVTYQLPDVFMVFATQNPLEFEGVYPLPEAQVDRFLFKIIVNYPSEEDEKQLLQLHHATRDFRDLREFNIARILDNEALNSVRDYVRSLKVRDDVTDYIINLIRATRNHPAIDLGASPRAALHVVQSAKAVAAVKGREYITPDDIKLVFLPALRHRIVTHYTAEIEGTGPDALLSGILGSVAVPR